MESLSDQLTGDQQCRLESFGKDFVCINGLLMRKNDELVPAPVTLLPSPIPHKILQHCMKIQKDYNLLYHKVACDHTFLVETLKSTVVGDDYMTKLWSIYETVHEEGLAQPIFLGLNRSDYMLHRPDAETGNLAGTEVMQAKQVEFNLMASSFGGLMQNLVPFHRQMLRFLGQTEARTEQTIPWNAASDGFAKGMLTAWKLYDNPQAAILIVVSESENNIFDQRLLERSCYALNPDVRILRMSFDSLKTEARLTEDRKLMVGNKEVGLVYFRCGYVPAHFPDEETWQLKLLMERSRALKCPCIQYMLANTKRVQMALTSSGTLQRYIASIDTVDNLVATFVGQYDLTNRKHVDDALANPEKYVLKPQREGGGNNFYKDQLKQKLEAIKDTTEARQYILMERIFPPAVNGYVLKHEEKGACFMKMISELGIYGVFIGAGETVYANYQCGHLLRSKPETTDEGGVSTGYAFLDSPYLI